MATLTPQRRPRNPLNKRVSEIFCSDNTCALCIFEAEAAADEEAADDAEHAVVDVDAEPQYPQYGIERDGSVNRGSQMKHLMRLRRLLVKCPTMRTSRSS